MKNEKKEGKIPLIAGNWKMNNTSQMVVEFINTLSPKISEFNTLVYLAVPYTYINVAAKAAENSRIIIGGQNMNDAEKGAFTGEIASIMLKEAGAEFVLLGHSERRHIFNEDDDFINKKVVRAIKDDIQPILCIGETLEERENKETEKRLESQITKGLKGISAQDVEDIIIAYEPVWAIGTGKTATAEMAQKAHAFIRSVLEKLYDSNVADKIYILYGGSVKADNANEILSEKDIDGVLVGGASLEEESFYNIIKNS